MNSSVSFWENVVGKYSTLQLGAWKKQIVSTRRWVIFEVGVKTLLASPSQFAPSKHLLPRWDYKKNLNCKQNNNIKSLFFIHQQERRRVYEWNYFIFVSQNLCRLLANKKEEITRGDEYFVVSELSDLENKWAAFWESSKEMPGENDDSMVSSKNLCRFSHEKYFLVTHS